MFILCVRELLLKTTVDEDIECVVSKRTFEGTSVSLVLSSSTVMLTFDPYSKGFIPEVGGKCERWIMNHDPITVFIKAWRVDPSNSHLTMATTSIEIFVTISPERPFQSSKP